MASPEKQNDKNINVEIEIPKQTEFYKIPARFGSVPVDSAPLGWEIETRAKETKITKFEHTYPKIFLPFQEVRRVEFGHSEKFIQEDKNDPIRRELFPKGANRLFFGDNLHIMRQLPSKSIDLIYIDPPFFSGRNYNMVFGDKNEVRSFSDIWEGGMPGYLVWLNVRLYEMKRLLKDTGSIYVHLDWHASHYVKVEMDKIFGVDNFLNEVIIHYSAVGLKAKSKKFHQNTESILSYAKIRYKHIWNDVIIPAEPRIASKHIFNPVTKKAERVRNRDGKIEYFEIAEQKADNFIEVPALRGSEKIGYPTQKPEAIIERLIKASSNEGDVVADFFCGGGTTLAVAQKLNRRWIGCDQSRIAVAITADRIVRTVEEKIGTLFEVPDFTVEHWGVYEIPRLENLSIAEFREFVVKAFGGKPENVSPHIHGSRAGVPLYVGEPSRRTKITKDDVVNFSKAIFKDRKTNFGTMLAWNFGPDAKRAAEILAARENKRIDFVRLSLIRLESDEFREHIVIKHKDYGGLLSFVQPPDVIVRYERIGKLKYRFDVSESVSLNKDGMIANVQWDFNYRGKFSSTEGYSFLRDKVTGRPVLVVEYEFPKVGKYEIACSVQDDRGGEKTVVLELEVK